LIFGVNEKPRQIVGDPATLRDEAQWANRLKEDFDPEIVIATKRYAASGLQVFVVG
jgi:uncharacterized membrane-anchored protein